MSLGNENFYKILSFVHEQMGYIWWSKKKLTRQTRLLQELKIDGDDAEEFFIAFEQQFKVDLTSLDLSMYFNSEGFDLLGLSHLMKRFGLKIFFDNKSLKSITLGDLERAVETGKWIHNLK